LSELAQWELSLYFVDYVPICGHSYEHEGYKNWSNSEECQSAMQQFNSSLSSVEVYDLAGRSNSPIARGSRSCLCFTVRYTPIADGAFDICLLVGESGEIMESIDKSSGNPVGVGIQCIQNELSKSLPICATIDLPNTTSALSSGGALSPTDTPNSPIHSSSTILTDFEQPTSTSPTGGQTNINSNNKEHANEDGGLKTTDKIALGVGLPGAILAIGTLVRCCWTYSKKKGSSSSAYGGSTRN
jgi:hypothetical protein